MKPFKILLTSVFVLFFIVLNAQKEDYKWYHQQVGKAEKLIINENYSAVLAIYEELFSTYDFVFLKEYKIATQLALYLKKEDLANQYLEQGILSGWTKKAIKKNVLLNHFRSDKQYWRALKKNYPIWRRKYEQNLDDDLRKKVKRMFGKDQRKAIRALLHFSSKGQDKYAEKIFAPHSEEQMAELFGILDKHGYPGERLIGNDFWMSTIISHHNSISKDYALQDTLYLNLKPKLKMALLQGQISPFEFAGIDMWCRSMNKDNKGAVYGILQSTSTTHLQATNELRAAIFLRSVETRNKLLDIEEKTGMNFYLQGHPWIDGKILFD